MRLDTIQNRFWAAGIQDQDKPLEFFKLQHRFKPARFELHKRSNWDEDVVIPIYHSNPIKEGGTAELYQIDVPEEFVGWKLRDACAGSRFNAGSEESPDWVCCPSPGRPRTPHSWLIISLVHVAP